MINNDTHHFMLVFTTVLVLKRPFQPQIDLFGVEVGCVPKRLGLVIHGDPHGLPGYPPALVKNATSTGAPLCIYPYNII